MNELPNLERPPNAARLDAYRSETVAGLWNRWYDGDDPGMDAPVGALRWAVTLSHEQIVQLARRVEEEYS